MFFYVIIMMSGKMATPGLLKITIFRNITITMIPDQNVTNRILLCNSNYFVDAIM